MTNQPTIQPTDGHEGSWVKEVTLQKFHIFFSPDLIKIDIGPVFSLGRGKGKTRGQIWEIEARRQGEKERSEAGWP